MTLVDMVEATGYTIHSVLDVGCAYGFVVQELLGRGYCAVGVDFSEECILESPVKDRLVVGDATVLPLDRRFDLVIVANLCEHLTDEQCQRMIEGLAKTGDRLLAIINKSTHDPSHINIKSNREWVSWFERHGFVYDNKATLRARAKYLEKSNGTEAWHRDCLVFLSPSLELRQGRSASAVGGLAVTWMKYAYVYLRHLGRKVSRRLSRS